MKVFVVATLSSAFVMVAARSQEPAFQYQAMRSESAFCGHLRDFMQREVAQPFEAPVFSEATYGPESEFGHRTSEGVAISARRTFQMRYSWLPRVKEFRSVDWVEASIRANERALSFPALFAVVDATGDGVPDTLIKSRFSGELSVMRSQGDTGLVPVTESVIVVPGRAISRLDAETYVAASRGTGLAAGRVSVEALSARPFSWNGRLYVWTFNQDWRDVKDGSRQSLIREWVEIVGVSNTGKETQQSATLRKHCEFDIK